MSSSDSISTLGSAMQGADSGGARLVRLAGSLAGPRGGPRRRPGSVFVVVAAGPRVSGRARSAPRTMSNFAKRDRGFRPHAGAYKGKSVEEVVQESDGRGWLAEHIPTQRPSVSESRSPGCHGVSSARSRATISPRSRIGEHRPVGSATSREVGSASLRRVTISRSAPHAAGRARRP